MNLRGWNRKQIGKYKPWAADLKQWKKEGKGRAKGGVRKGSPMSKVQCPKEKQGGGRRAWKRLSLESGENLRLNSHRFGFGFGLGFTDHQSSLNHKSRSFDAAS